MSKLREAAQQALAQLEINRTNFRKGPSKSICKMLAGGNDEVIEALKAALAEPQTTHSALLKIPSRDCDCGAEPCPCGDRPADKCPGEWEPGCGLGNSSDYAKRAEPVQDGPCKYCTDGCPACDARKLPMVEIETVLTVQGEPVQEPVAWMVYTLDGKSVCVTDNPADFTEQHKALPLYTGDPIYTMMQDLKKNGEQQ